MQRRGVFFIQLSATVVGAAFLSAAEDVQTITSRRSTLSIYSYGGLAPSRALPEFRDESRTRKRKTAPLTDVVSTPPPGASAEWPSKNAGAIYSTKNVTAPASTSSANSRTGTTGARSADSSGVPNLSPVSQVVTVAWNPSPDESVVGYHLYTGDASGEYSAKTPVGNQPSAQIVVDQSAVYVAVSAYNALGLESVLSEELVLFFGRQDASPAGGTGTISSDTL